MSNTFFMSFGDQKDTFCDKSTTSYKYAIGISKKKTTLWLQIFQK